MTWLRAHGRLMPEQAMAWVMWSHLFSFVWFYVWTTEDDLKFALQMAYIFGFYLVCILLPSRRGWLANKTQGPSTGITNAHHST